MLHLLNQVYEMDTACNMHGESYKF